MTERQIVPTKDVRKPKDAPEDDSRIYRRWATDPIIVAAREVVTFEVDTPTGPMEVTYGKHDHYGPSDRLTARFRAEDVSAAALRPRPDSKNVFGSVLGSVAQVEADHRAKKARDDARKEAAKHPEPCHIVQATNPRHRHSQVGAERRLVPGHVRGIDLRSNDALVTLLDGTKTSVSPRLVLRDLDRDEKHDVESAYAYLVDARKAVERHTPKDVTGALADLGIEVDLTVHYDPESDGRWADVDGVRYWGKDDRSLIRRVAHALLLADGTYRYYERDRDHEPVLLAEGDDDFDMRTSVYRTIEEWKSERDAKATKATAAEDVDSVEEEYRFDLSLFAGVADEAKARDEVETQLLADIGRVKAPEVEPEWDD